MLRGIRQNKKRDDEEYPPGPPPVTDFGFTHPFGYVEQTVQFLKLSSWTCWPEAGGWADQDAALIEDVMAYLRLEQWLEYELEHPGVTETQLPDETPKMRL